jgi:Fe-S cluster assembly protein SufB
MATADLDLGRYQLGWSDAEDYIFKPKKGINESIVREMSEMKNEPEWMRNFRLKALKHFERKPMAPWFAQRMPQLDFNDIYYYIKPTGGQVNDWDDLPDAIKNTYEKLGIPEAERKYLSGVTAQYECLVGSTKVWTTRGMRPIKELGAGDEVFALNEDSRLIEVARVVAGDQSGEKEILEITARGRTIRASGNHPFLVLRDEPEPGARSARVVSRWVPAEELAEGDLVAIATDLPEFGHNAPMMLPDDARGDLFPRVTSDDMCWFLGLFLGDGYLKHSDGYTTVAIAVDKTDTVLVEEIRRVAKVLFGLDFSLSADGYRLQARGTAALAQYLELNGLGGTSHTKRIPEWVFALPSSQRVSFVAGLLDADGYVRMLGDKAKDLVFTSVNHDLLAAVKELLALSGIWSSIVLSITSKHPFDRDRIMQAFRLHVSGRFDRIPARSPRRSDRMSKKMSFKSYRGSKTGPYFAHTSEMLGFVKVEKIERLGVEPVYDIEVEGHHNFVAEGFVVHNSEVVFHRNRADLEEQGVLFCDMDTAVREYPEIVQKWFGTLIPPGDNKFAALNSAVWSGGSFIYVPPGVKVDMPLQAYFRINAENMGQFERTLIIADEGSQVHYIEGCSAPVYSTDSLHSAVVELVALQGARITYTTIQNWSNNVYNLVTKRARAEAEAHVEWIDGNIGSRLTMKYPSVYLMGPKASGEVLSVAYAGAGQHQDAGAKMFHVAPETSSTIVSKSISKDGGITTYRGKVHVDKGATGAKSFVRCDALLLDDDSTSETKPYMEVGERDARIGHEATVSKVGEDQLFYLMSRGLSESQAMGMIVNGFIEPVTRTLPMEYAVEWSRLIELQMEGSVG